MHVLIARLNHETNTFSPVPTPLAAFGDAGPQYDEAAYRAHHGQRTAMGAFIELAHARGATMVTPVSGWAYPSGPVAQEAYEDMAARIVAATIECDAILLDLHGAMVAEHCDDGEGELLRRIRQAAPGVPIGVALDLHGNVTQTMIDHADVIVSFKTYPHVDMYETGEHVAKLLFAMLDGECRPTMTWRQLPLMTHTLRSDTSRGTMQAAVESARALESRGMLAVSVLAGFSLADIARPCISVITIADGNAQAAEQAAAELAAQIWQERDGFVYQSEPLDQALISARDMAAGQTRPILLLDHGDNCNSGGTCDTTAVLEAALARGLDNILAGLICDPEAVAQLTAAGLGAEVSVAVGNKRSLAHLGIHAKPVTLTGKVLALTDGQYRISGPTYTGMLCSMGRTAVLDIGPARLVICERPHEPWDLGVFESVGQDPRLARYLLLKSRMYCRPVFVPISAGLVECDSPGATTSDYSVFPYRKRERPLYPLETVPENQAPPA